MTKCPKCDGFTELVNFATPVNTWTPCAKLVEVVNQGSLLLVFASCPVQDIFNLLSQETASFTIFNAPRAGVVPTLRRYFSRHSELDTFRRIADRLRPCPVPSPQPLQTAISQ